MPFVTVKNYRVKFRVQGQNDMSLFLIKLDSQPQNKNVGG